MDWDRFHGAQLCLVEFPTSGISSVLLWPNDHIQSDLAVEYRVVSGSISVTRFPPEPLYPSAGQGSRKWTSPRRAWPILEVRSKPRLHTSRTYCSPYRLRYEQTPFEMCANTDGHFLRIAARQVSPL